MIRQLLYHHYHLKTGSRRGFPWCLALVLLSRQYNTKKDVDVLNRLCRMLIRDTAQAPIHHPLHHMCYGNRHTSDAVTGYPKDKEAEAEEAETPQQQWKHH